MGENNIELGAGILYFNGMEVDVNSGEAEMIFTEEPDDISVKPMSMTGELSFTTECKIDRWLFNQLSGFYAMVVRYCPNRRVAHLAKYGKNDRVRHKNFNRAVKIICKEFKKGHLHFYAARGRS